jgi:hypothetical protein
MHERHQVFFLRGQPENLIAVLLLRRGRPFILIARECLGQKKYLLKQFLIVLVIFDRLCGLVVRVSAYRSRGLRFDSRRYQIFCVVVGLERGPLSLMRIIEELFQGNSGSGLENRD